jgi:hypothetical protein
MELVLRFLVFRQLPESEMSSLGDMGEFLTDKMIEFANRQKYNYKLEERAFRTTFQILKEQASSDSFRRYDPLKSRFLGGFSVSAFEAVALGVGYNFEPVKTSPATVPEKLKQIWSDDEFVNNSGSGIRASSRVPKVVPYARKLFTP